MARTPTAAPLESSTATPRPLRWTPSRVGRLVRRSVFHWAVVFALAALSATLVHRLTQEADRRLAAYGDLTEVAVTTHAVARGEPLAAATEIRSVPRAFLPDLAVDTFDTDSVAAHDLVAGSIVTRPALADTDGLAAGQVGIAVPRGPTTPHLVRGQRVLVIVHADPFGGVEAGEVEGTVLAFDDSRVIVVVDRGEAPSVATALAGSGVTLALLP